MIWILLLAWIGVAFVVALLAVRLFPESWVKDGKLIDNSRSIDMLPTSVQLFGVAMAWPASFVFGAFLILTRSAARAVASRETTRKELENELAAAKKEIDDLLRTK